ncbi:SET domain-containing protein [Aureobasidium sp. EXF-10728]|nr:SET domain-containing protein [Aureobasidium sp. EXF-10728]
MSSHGPVIKVVHPSDILALQPSHKLVPKAFLDLSGPSVNSVRDWVEEAQVALGKGEYTKTIAVCSNAFERFSNTEDAVDILETLHQCRSVAAMCAGYYDLATADAVAFISGCTDEQLKGHRQFLHRAACAAYQKQDYSLAQNLFQRLLKLIPKDNSAIIMCNNTRLRLLEERDGIYDFAAMAKKQLPIYHASFTNLTEIRASCGRGRGLFAKVDIPRGGLVLCEKAFASSEVEEAAKTTKSNAYSGDDQGAQLWLDVVQKAFRNPSQAQRLIGLYAGPAYSTQTNVPTVDGQPVIDVYQIESILFHNTFAHQAKIDSGGSLFIQASYANHSCIDNTHRSFVGDTVVLRAVNDIAAGTELTTSYWPAALDEPDRHEDLFKNWKFVCKCKLCESESECDQDWEETFKTVRKLLEEKYSDKKEFIVKIEQLAKRLESVYPCHLFGHLPRIAMQDLQSKLLKLWVALDDQDKIRKHAIALLREYGFRVETTNNSPRIQLKGPNGLLHEPVVKALYQLGRVSADEDGKEYLALSKAMWLAMNGTSEGWKKLIA